MYLPPMLSYFNCTFLLKSTYKSLLHKMYELFQNIYQSNTFSKIDYVKLAISQNAQYIFKLYCPINFEFPNTAERGHLEILGSFFTIKRKLGNP